MIVSTLKAVYRFLKDSIDFIGFLIQVVYTGNFYNPLKRLSKNKAVLLANGPSLKKILPKLSTSAEFESKEFFVLNYFANHEVFFKIKPNHYSFADPMFFQPTHREEEVKRLFEILQTKVDWQIFIYVPTNRYSSFLKFSNLSNPCLKIMKMNTTPYRGYEIMRNFFYRLGLAMPIPGTVANLAIFAALNQGFAEIKLYGVDHTFFDSLCVNENNVIGNRQTHFYGDDSIKIKPILRIDTGEPYKVSDYLYSIMIMFESHNYLSEYATYLNTRIINCTENSMIDSYERI